MPKRVIQVDEERHIAGVDGDARGQIVIDVHHDKVHDGDAYVASADYTSVGASGAVLLMVLPNLTTKYHSMFSVFGDDAGTVEVYSQPTVVTASNAGAIFAYNHNRTSTNSSKVLFYSAINYTSGSGNLIWRGRLGTNNQKVVTGGDLSNEYEWILQSGSIIVKYVPAGTGKVSVIRSYYYEVA